MKVKILFASFLFFMGIQPMSAQTRQQEMDRFIDNLMSQMTLQEKIGHTASGASSASASRCVSPS